MWTAILILFIALLFFVPIIFWYIFEQESHVIEIIVMSIILSGFFFVSLFIWSEQAYDEREESQQLQMNKWAFIMGGMTIIIIIIYQSFTGEVDIALPIILLVMLGCKLIMKNYYRLKDA
jgi:hypothetical protein